MTTTSAGRLSPPVLAIQGHAHIPFSPAQVDGLSRLLSQMGRPALGQKNLRFGSALSVDQEFDLLELGISVDADADKKSLIVDVSRRRSPRVPKSRIRFPDKDQEAVTKVLASIGQQVPSATFAWEVLWQYPPKVAESAIHLPFPAPVSALSELQQVRGLRITNADQTRWAIVDLMPDDKLLVTAQFVTAVNIDLTLFGQALKTGEGLAKEIVHVLGGDPL